MTHPWWQQPAATTANPISSPAPLTDSTTVPQPATQQWLATARQRWQSEAAANAEQVTDLPVQQSGPAVGSQAGWRPPQQPQPAVGSQTGWRPSQLSEPAVGPQNVAQNGLPAGAGRVAADAATTVSAWGASVNPSYSGAAPVSVPLMPTGGVSDSQAGLHPATLAVPSAPTTSLDPQGFVQDRPDVDSLRISPPDPQDKLAVGTAQAGHSVESYQEVPQRSVAIQAWLAQGRRPVWAWTAKHWSLVAGVSLFALGVVIIAVL